MTESPRRYVLGVALGSLAGLLLSVFLFGVSASFPVFLVQSLATVGLTVAVVVTVLTRRPGPR